MDFFNNNITTKYGIWVRPDENLYGTNYEKLFILNYIDVESISWQTLQLSTFEISSSHVLINFPMKHVWKMYSIDTEAFESTFNNDLLVDENDLSIDKEDLIFDSNGLIIGISGEAFDPELLNNYYDDFEDTLFAESNIQSYLERQGSSLIDISWERLYNLDNIMFENYNPEEIVWMVQKHWTHDSKYAKSDSIELTIWLDNFSILNDGTEVWSDSRTGLNSLLRIAMNKVPYETSRWTADIPGMFSLFRHVYALRNSVELMVSYIANDPLNIKYVIMKAFKKSLFEDMKRKDKEWSIYDYYKKDKPYKLFNDDIFFKDNSVY